MTNHGSRCIAATVSVPIADEWYVGHGGDARGGRCHPLRPQHRERMELYKLLELVLFELVVFLHAACDDRLSHVELLQSEALNSAASALMSLLQLAVTLAAFFSALVSSQPGAHLLIYLSHLIVT